MPTTAPQALSFSHCETVTVDGRDIELEISCRAMLDHDEEGWWMSGVEPGGVLEGSSCAAKAALGFQAALGEILREFAREARHETELRERVAKFVAEKDEYAEGRWEAARAAA